MEPILSMMQRDRVVTLLRDVQQYLNSLQYDDNHASSLCTEIERVLDQLMGVGFDPDPDALYNTYDLPSSQGYGTFNATNAFTTDPMTSKIDCDPIKKSVHRQRRRKKNKKTRKRKRSVMVHQFHTHIHYHGDTEDRHQSQSSHHRSPKRRRLCHSNTPSFDDHFNDNDGIRNREYVPSVQCTENVHPDDENTYYLSQTFMPLNGNHEGSNSDLEILSNGPSNINNSNPSHPPNPNHDSMRSVDSSQRETPLDVGFENESISNHELDESSPPQSVQSFKSSRSNSKTTGTAASSIGTLIDEMHANNARYEQEMVQFNDGEEDVAIQENQENDKRRNESFSGTKSKSKEIGKRQNVDNDDNSNDTVIGLKSSKNTVDGMDGVNQNQPEIVVISSNSETEEGAEGILSNLNSVPMLEPMHSADRECPESETSIEGGVNDDNIQNGMDRVTVDYITENTVDQPTEPKFYSMFTYFDPDHQRNILLPKDNGDVPVLEDDPNTMALSDAFWWNKYFAIKFAHPQFRDPLIGRLSNNLTSNHLDKSLCYRYPPVFESWKSAPKSAPYPYLVKERITTISDTQFLRKALVPFWNQKITLTTRPRQETFGGKEEDSMNVSTSNCPQEVRLSEMFRINGKYGRVLLEWCQQCRLSKKGKGNGDRDSDDDDLLEISIGHRLNEYMPFTVGDVYLGAKNHGKSPRKYLKFDQSDPKALQFMSQEHDLLRGEQLANMHIATYGARTPWHHDLGLCSWLQMLYGEKNVKIWDVESSKLIEEYKNDSALSAQEKEDYISGIHPKWSCWLRPGMTLFMPSGCGHLVTTTSNCAVMVTGSFVPNNQVRIGYEMAKYEDKGYLKSQDLDWDKMVIRLTTNVFGKESKRKKSSKKERITIEHRLRYLETATEQTNWNMEYTTISGEAEAKIKDGSYGAVSDDLNALRSY